MLLKDAVSPEKENNGFEKVLNFAYKNVLEPWNWDITNNLSTKKPIYWCWKEKEMKFEISDLGTNLKKCGKSIAI